MQRLLRCLWKFRAGPQKSQQVGVRTFIVASYTVPTCNLYSQTQCHNKVTAKRRGALPIYEKELRLSTQGYSSQITVKQSALMAELTLIITLSNITTKDLFCSRPK